MTLKNVVNFQVTSKVRPDISKSVLSKSRLHKLQAFIENILGIEMCIKFESEEISITGDYCSRSDSKEEEVEVKEEEKEEEVIPNRSDSIEEEVRSFALRD